MSASLEFLGVRPLEWDYISHTGTWQAKSLIGEYSVGFDDGWWGQLEGPIGWEWDAPMDPRSYSGPSEAQFAAQADHEARILSVIITREIWE